MIRVTLEFADQAALVAFFSAPSEASKPAKGAQPAAASTPRTAAAGKTDAPAQTPAEKPAPQPAAAEGEVTPEMGSALIVKMLPVPEHKAAAAEILAKHKVKGFKYLDTAAKRAACYADLKAKAAELGVEV